MHALQDSALLQMWRTASKHYNGEGLELGSAYEHSIATLRKFRKEKLYAKAAALDTIHAAAMWSPDRKAFAGLLDLVRHGYFDTSERILFLHTGGAPGLFAYSGCLTGV